MIRMILLLTIMVSCIIPQNLQARQCHYPFPAVISLELKEAANHSGKLMLEGMMRSKIGQLKKMQVFFEASPDLSLSHKPIFFEALPEEEFKTFALVVEKRKEKPDDMGSWVRMRVRFLPDYERLRTFISNPASYPIEVERNRLLEILTSNQKRKATQTEAVRFFLP